MLLLKYSKKKRELSNQMTQKKGRNAEMAEALILVKKNEGIGTLILNNPANMNAFSQPLADELAAALEKMWSDRAVRVVIIRGAGGNFSAGGNIKGMKERVDCFRLGVEPETDARKNLRNLNRIVSLVRNMDKPVIAWLEGAVAGGGLSLAMACDFSIADEACKLVFAFTKIGLAPDMGSSLLMTRRVGMPRATELFMTGRPFNGRQAADWGIITDAVPAVNLQERVIDLANNLASGPLRSYAAIKSTLNRVMYQGLDDVMTAEVETQNTLIHSADHMEAVTAFIEKRLPVFQGK